MLSRFANTLLDVQSAESVPAIKELLFFGKSLGKNAVIPDKFEDAGTPVHLYDSENLSNADYVFTVNGDSIEAEFKQLSLIESAPDLRAPETVTWNLWHGCTKVSPSHGCKHCYMFRRDLEIGTDPTVVRKTQSFNLPVRRYRGDEYKGLYKLPPGSHVFTCFSSNFFHKDADEWRNDAWVIDMPLQMQGFLMTGRSSHHTSRCSARQDITSFQS